MLLMEMKNVNLTFLCLYNKHQIIFWTMCSILTVLCDITIVTLEVALFTDLFLQLSVTQRSLRRYTSSTKKAARYHSTCFIAFDSRSDSAISESRTDSRSWTNFSLCSPDLLTASSTNLMTNYLVFLFFFAIRPSCTTLCFTLLLFFGLFYNHDNQYFQDF